MTKQINFLIRNIPAPLWQRAKHRAVDDNWTLRELVLAALEAYLKGDNSWNNIKPTAQANMKLFSARRTMSRNCFLKNICAATKPLFGAETNLLVPKTSCVLREEFMLERMQKVQNKILNFLIRNIPPDLWQRAKHRAVDDNCTLRELVLAALEAYLKENAN